MTYFINNHTEKTSQPISINDIPEAAGISAKEFATQYDGDIDKLNKDLYEFDFSVAPKYSTIGTLTDSELDEQAEMAALIQDTEYLEVINKERQKRK